MQRPGIDLVVIFFEVSPLLITEGCFVPLQIELELICLEEVAWILINLCSRFL